MGRGSRTHERTATGREHGERNNELIRGKWSEVSNASPLRNSLPVRFGKPRTREHTTCTEAKRMEV
jgi:hypothetical protein